MVIYWPKLSGNPAIYRRFWFSQLHKHGSRALFQGDFLKIALDLGMDYIKEFQRFMAEEGYNKPGIYNCLTFQEKLNARMKFEVAAIFGWDGIIMPKIIKLLRIEILHNRELVPFDYYRPQHSINLETQFFELKIPDISDYAIPAAHKGSPC